MRRNRHWWGLQSKGRWCQSSSPSAEKYRCLCCRRCWCRGLADNPHRRANKNPMSLLTLLNLTTSLHTMRMNLRQESNSKKACQTVQVEAANSDERGTSIRSHRCWARWSAKSMALATNHSPIPATARRNTIRRNAIPPPEWGTIDDVVDVVVSWAWTSIIPAMLAALKRTATTNDFFGNFFINFFFVCLQI